ncbi:hypothetical protein [uncultured Mediterranean phage uvMED]|nr:hypothetical protein [uncultured Mediterranean phage uvMED]
MNRNFLASLITVIAVFTIIPIIPLVIAFLAGIILKRRIDNVPGNRTVNGQLLRQSNGLEAFEASQASHERDWQVSQTRRTKHIHETSVEYR